MKKLGDENLVMVQEVQNLEVCTRTQYEKPGTTVRVPTVLQVVPGV